MQKPNRKAANRLRDALQHADLNMTLAILMAQQKECIIHKETSTAPVKLACQMVDECQATFLQFVNFLKTYMKIDEFSRRIPALTELLTDFRLGHDAAFHLTRPIFWHRAQVR